MWKYFKLEEFACKHCGENKISDVFVYLLDDLRHALNHPLVVSSGYRCPIHNNNVSSTGLSGPHTTGKAADISIYGEQAYNLVEQAMLMGFTGIGVNQKGANRFIHLDILGGIDRPRIWSY